MAGQYELLRSFLTDRIIAFHPRLARLFGGINEALLFQQLAYWADKGQDPEWIYKTQKEIEEETTLTRTQQEGARKKLRSLGVIAEQRKGVPAKLYYKVEWDVLFALLSQDAENLQSRMRETSSQDRREPADQIAGNLPSITESTQRTQTENGSKSRKAPVDYDKDREALLPYLEDFARELGDSAPLTSTLSRAVNLYRQSGLTLEQFIEQMYQARAVTKEHSGAIKGTKLNGGTWGRKGKIQYWFKVLEERVTA